MKKFYQNLIFIFSFIILLVSCKNELEKGKLDDLQLVLMEDEFELIDFNSNSNFPDFTNNYTFELTDVGLQDAIHQIERTSLYNFVETDTSSAFKNLLKNKITGYWIKKSPDEYVFQEPFLGVDYPYNSMLFSSDTYTIQGGLDVENKMLYYTYTNF